MSEVFDLSTPWRRAALARALFALAPSQSGLALRAGAGPVRDAFLGGLRESLPAATPWRRAPANITDDRLLGGLDLAATLRHGRPVVEHGLLAEADGGVVVLAMAERISPGAAARIARAFDQGEVSAEREGFSIQAPARFGLIALDEGQGDDERAPAALLERLAFWVDLTEIGLNGREDDPFSPRELEAARARLNEVETNDDAIATLVGAAAELGVASLRAPLFEEKVVDFLVELADVTENKVSREELFKEDDTAAA